MSETKRPKIQPAIILVYSQPDLIKMEDKNLARNIAACERELQDGDIKITWQANDGQNLLGQIQFSDHQIRLIGLASPVPTATIDRTINLTHWPPQTKAAMRHHQSHIICIYQGKNQDPIKKNIALYQTACGLKNENLMGILNEQAWTAHPIGDFLTAEKIISYRENLPFILWVGYVKFFTDKKHHWLVTKGHHIFGVPELAYFLQVDEKDTDIMEHFINIFLYMYDNKKKILPGDTIEIAGKAAYFRFSDAAEHQEALMLSNETLILERISGKERNL